MGAHLLSQSSGERPGWKRHAHAGPLTPPSLCLQGVSQRLAELGYPWFEVFQPRQVDLGRTLQMQGNLVARFKRVDLVVEMGDAELRVGDLQVVAPIPHRRGSQMRWQFGVHSPRHPVQEFLSGQLVARWWLGRYIRQYWGGRLLQTSDFDPHPSEDAASLINVKLIHGQSNRQAEHPLGADRLSIHIHHPLSVPLGLRWNTHCQHLSSAVQDLATGEAILMSCYSESDATIQMRFCCHCRRRWSRWARR
jgi:hypothetical protein